MLGMLGKPSPTEPKIQCLQKTKMLLERGWDIQCMNNKCLSD
jgi:hypothetical protein